VAAVCKWPGYDTVLQCLMCRLPRPGRLCGLLVPDPRFPRESTSIVLAKVMRLCGTKRKALLVPRLSAVLILIFKFYYCLLLMSDNIYILFLYYKLIHVIL